MYSGQGLIKPYISKFSFVARSFDSLVITLAVYAVALLNGIEMKASYWLMALCSGLIFQLFAEFSDIYRSWRTDGMMNELRQVFLCWLLCFGLVVIASTISPYNPNILNGSESLQWFLACLSVLFLWRVAARLLLRKLRTEGFNTKSIAIVGTGDLATKIHAGLKDIPWVGYRLVGFFDDHEVSNSQPNEKKTQQYTTDAPGSLDALVKLAEEGAVNDVYITSPMREEEKIKKLIDRLSNSTVGVYLVPDLFMFEMLHARSMNINGLPTISVVSNPNHGVNSWIKRAEDIFGSMAILTLIAIPMLVIAVGIKFTSRGPVLFKQIRYGLDGKEIKVWKFRSMTVMENGSDFRQATKGDARITPFGAFLRKTSLDELPQFLNVLQGSMSIVGPRPHAVAHNEEFRGQVKSYMRRHKVKPGVTGWAQINGWRGETDTLEKMEKRIEHDLHYIQNWSLWWDMKIIIKTVFKGFFDKNAY